MTDSLKIFSDGQKITAEDTNDNNRYLESLNTESITTLQGYIDGQLALIQSNLTSQISSINNNITEMQTSINTLESKTAEFVSKSLDIGSGTTNLSSGANPYLPNDSYNYLVWVYNNISGSSSSPVTTTVATDIFPTTYIATTDGDSGRDSENRTLVAVPVGPQRKITVTQSCKLKGYMRI